MEVWEEGEIVLFLLNVLRCQKHIRDNERERGRGGDYIPIATLSPPK